MAATPTPRIAIIGAGLGGLAFALSLHAHGIPCTIYEARPAPAADSSNQTSYFTPNGDGGYLALAPNALRVLDRIGAYEKIRTAGFNFEQMQMRSARNMSLLGSVQTGADKEKGYKSVRVARGHVRRVLLNLAEENAVKIEFDRKFSRLEESSQGVTVYFDDQTTVKADLVIGADGIHSKLRDHLESNTKPVFSGMVGVGGPLDAAKLDDVRHGTQMPCMVMGKGNSFAFMPCSYDGSKLAVFATFEMKDRSRDDWNAFMKDQGHLKSMMTTAHDENSEWPEIVKKACLELNAEEMFAWPTYQVPTLQRYVSEAGKVVLLGDSAHGIPPHGGQGAAMAFEDAATLADVIAAKDSNVLLERLLRWQEHRTSRIEQVKGLVGRLGSYRKASPGLVQQIVKEWMMTAFFWWKGGDSGTEWLYGYDTHKV